MNVLRPHHPARRVEISADEFCQTESSDFEKTLSRATVPEQRETIMRGNTARLRGLKRL